MVHGSKHCNLFHKQVTKNSCWLCLCQVTHLLHATLKMFVHVQSTGVMKSSTRLYVVPGAHEQRHQEMHQAHMCKANRRCSPGVHDEAHLDTLTC